MSSVRLLPPCFAAAVLAALLLQRGEGAPVPPALYTKAQAQQGRAVFEQHCAVCHGRHLEGRVGPALKGERFASVKAGFTIQEIFDFLSVEMPAYAPGSLTGRQYLEITAFLLQQNGYPAGKTALTAQIASRSTVALVYREPHEASSEAATQGLSTPRSAKQKPPVSPHPPHAPSGKPLVALTGGPGS